MVFGWLKKLTSKGPDYWDLIDPYWEKVSIYEGGDVFLKAYEELPEPSKHLLAAHWLQSEVNNGGFGQFCSNSTGVLAPEARDGFVALGMPQVAALVAQYLDFWGEVYPRDQEEREDLWEALSEQRYGIDENGDLLGGHFEDIDDQFFELIETENGGFRQAANAYAARFSVSSQ